MPQFVNFVSYKRTHGNFPSFVDPCKLLSPLLLPQ